MCGRDVPGDEDVCECGAIIGRRGPRDAVAARVADSGPVSSQVAVGSVAPPELTPRWPATGWGPVDPRLPILRPVRGLSWAVWAALGGWCLVTVGLLVVTAQELSVLRGWAEDQTLTSGSAAADAGQLALVWTVVQFVASVAVAASLLTWLWRARANAFLLRPDGHRRHRAWVIWGWIVPVVSLWFPKQILDDVWSASAPTTPRGLVAKYWACWLLQEWVSWLLVRGLESGEPTISDLVAGIDVSFGADVLGLGTAVLLGQVVWRITGFQEDVRRRQLVAR